MAQVELTLAATADQVKEPWISRLSKDFNVMVNIRQATVNADFGSMVIELDGPIEEIQRATAWLMTTGLRLRALQRAPGG